MPTVSNNLFTSACSQTVLTSLACSRLSQSDETKMVNPVRVNRTGFLHGMVAGTYQLVVGS